MTKAKHVILSLFLGALLVSSGCADKFAAAKIAVSVGRAATSATDSAFVLAQQSFSTSCTSKICLKEDPAQGAKYQTCMGKDHSAEEPYKTCMTKIVKAVAVWAKTKVVVNAAWDEVEALIKAAEQAKAGQTVDWMTPLKKAACLVARSLEFLPDVYKKKIAAMLALMQQFGCANPSSVKLPGQQ